MEANQADVITILSSDSDAFLILCYSYSTHLADNFFQYTIHNFKYDLPNFLQF